MSDPPRARRSVVAAPARRSPTELQSIAVILEPDPEPDVSHLKEFEERRKEYERGDFSFLIVRAVAEILIEDTVQTIVSPGQGVDSDTDEAYIEEIAAEEYTGLRKVLKTIGVATSQLPTEFDREWLEWRTE